MLPEQLSNHWCSLVPQQDRPVLVAEMWVDAEGQLKKHRFHRAMMRSAARLTYTRVQAAIDGRPDGETQKLLEPVLKPLYGAFGVLLAARQKRGALDLDLPERLVRLGEDGRIAEIGVRERLDSHRLIEEFMVLANVAAAQALEQRQAPCLYRVHDQPDAAKLESLRDFLATLGIALPVGQRPAPGRSQSRAACHRRQAGATGWSTRPILRSQSQAVYSPHNSAISAWRLGRYAHFTSPIRRFPT
jgi:ribonuclease R